MLLGQPPEHITNGNRQPSRALDCLVLEIAAGVEELGVAERSVEDLRVGVARGEGEDREQKKGEQTGLEKKVLKYLASKKR